MTIRLKCPNAKCQKVLVVKDELAGKRVRCPACKTSVSVGAPVAAPADLEDFAARAFSEDPVAPKAAAATAPKPTGTIDFNCFYCDAELHLPAEQGGKQVPCPECKRIIKVPALKEEKPKDWRDVEKKGPSFAKKDEPAKPAGAWDVARGKVSEEALEEAGVITEPEEPRTLGERLRLPLYAAGGVALVALAWWGYSAFLSRSAQQKALAAALSYVDLKSGKAKLGPAHAAAIQRGVGEYYVRVRKGEEARLAFAKARAAFMQGKTEVAPLEGDFLLADLALSQLGLGASDEKDLLNNERFEWGKTVEEVFQTLRAIESPDVQAAALREVVRRLREQDQKGAALGLANRLGNAPHAAAKGPKKAAPAEPSPVQAEAAALFLEMDKADKAADLLPALKGGGKGPDPLALLANAVAKALRGKFEEAQKEVSGAADPLDRLQAALAVGDVALGQGKTQDAVASAQLAEKAADDLAKAKRQVPPALGVLLVRLMAGAGVGDAKALADGLADKSARTRAQLELLKRALEKETSPAGAKKVDEWLKDKDTLSYALAQEAVARHDARLGHATDEAVETLEERLRPFVHIGVALGIQDRQK